MVSLPPSPPQSQTSFTQRIQFPCITEADLILSTEDGYDFAVYKSDILREGGILAKELEATEATDDILYEPTVYDVPDTYMVWWTILWQLYGDGGRSNDDLFCSLDRVYRAYVISTQLEMHSVADKVWAIVDTLTRKKPFDAFHTFFLAHKNGWIAHCEHAARYTLRYPDFPDFLSPYESALLQQYRNACAKVAIDALVSSMAPIASKHVPCWQNCGRCKSAWCINRDRWPSHWAPPSHSGPSVAVWFAEYFGDLCERLYRAPSSAVVRDSKLPIQYLLDSGSEVCKTCQTCRLHGLDNLERFRHVAKTKVSNAIAKVSTRSDMISAPWSEMLRPVIGAVHAGYRYC